MPTAWAPCPGKTKAIIAATPSRRRPAARPGRARRRRPAATPTTTALRIALADERPWPTSTRPDDAEQRRAAVLGVVDALAEAPERPARQQVADLARERARQLFAQQLLDHLDQAFAQLQHDVAGEAVADDDVGAAREDVAGLDVADEVERRRLQQPVAPRGSGRCPCLPLRRSTAGRPAAPRRRAARGRRPRPSRRIAAGASACTRRWRRRRAAPPCRAGSGWPAPAPADRRPSASRTRAWAATTAAPVCPALTTAAAAPDRAPARWRRGSTPAACGAAPTPGDSSIADDVGRVDHLRRRAPSASAMPRQLGVDGVAAPDQRHRHAASTGPPPARRRRSAPGRDRRPWRRRRSAPAAAGTAHDGPRGERRPHAEASGLLLVDRAHLSLVVEAAVGAHAVRRLRLAALRAGARRWWPAARRGCGACGRGSWSVGVLD